MKSISTRNNKEVSKSMEKDINEATNNEDFLKSIIMQVKTTFETGIY